MRESAGERGSVCRAAVTGCENYLVNRARTFIFSTAMPPYMAGQIRAALALAREAEAERVHLRAIAAALREGLTAAGLMYGTSATQIVPVMLGTNEAALHVASELQRDGFAVKAIRPPTVPAGTARIRISLTSKITMDDIHRLVAAISAAHKLLSQSIPAGVVHAWRQRPHPHKPRMGYPKRQKRS